MWSRSDPNITRRVPDFVYVHVSSCMLRYARYETDVFCGNGAWQWSRFFSRSKWKMIRIWVTIGPRRPYLNVNGPNDNFDKFQDLECHDRPQDPLRFDTITSIKTTIVMMNEICILILYMPQAHDADWRMIFINDSCNAPYWLNRL